MNNPARAQVEEASGPESTARVSHEALSLVCKARAWEVVLSIYKTSGFVYNRAFFVRQKEK